MWRAIFLCLPTAVIADSLVATRVIRAHQTLVAEDMALVAAEIPDALANASAAIGQEARVAIYPGRAIRAQDLGKAAIVERNQIVALAYQVGGLSIQTEGRALDRGGEGDVIELMNLSSKTKVLGRIGPDGTVYVGNRL